MIETQERIIDDATYSVTQLPARRALKLKAKLMKLFGPMVGQLYICTSGDQDAETSKKYFIQPIYSLTAQLDSNNLEALIMELMQGVMKNGVELTTSTIDL